MTLAQQRIYRINQIRATIEAAMQSGLIVSEEKLIAESCLQFGSSRRTVLEYLNALEHGGIIVRKDKKIWSTEAFNVDKLLKRK